MCGRVSLTKGFESAESRFKVKYTEDRDWPVIYNGPPSRDYPVITNEHPEEIHLFRWGLIPFWAKQKQSKYTLINARAETIEEKPTYKTPFHKRRCLVIADGFYEWKKTNGHKQPYRIMLENEQLFAFAGLWERWEGEDETVHSFTIITTEANDLIQDIHNRMPVILPPDTEKEWINNRADADHLRSLLQPYKSEEMRAYPVSTLVNNPQNDVPGVLNAIE